MQDVIQLVVEHEGLRWWFTPEPLTGMWIFHGPDAQLIPARPAEEREPREITVRRLKDWLTHWIYEEASREVELDGRHWRIRREPGITLMGRTWGERTTLPPPAGLLFTSDAGDVVFVDGRISGIRFVTMPQRELIRRLVENFP